MKQIYLIRHGETEFNRLGKVQGSSIDASLNDTGKEQAEAFFKKYRHTPFDKIYISTLKRTQETVKSFIDLGIPVEKHSGLNEISWGNHEGQTIAQLERGYYERLIRAWEKGDTDLRIKEGESPDDVAARQKGCLSIIKSRTEEHKILICSHGRAMRILLCQLLGLSLKEMNRFHHNNLGLYHLQMDTRNKVTLLRENCTEHLQEVVV
jgi:broad specificity phosphatase PhoE